VGPECSNEELLNTIQMVQQCGSQRKAAKALGLSQSAVCNRVQQAEKKGLYFKPSGSIKSLEAKKAPLPAPGAKKVYYITCAQDKTRLHEEWWKNLLALVAEDKAELLISTFKYNKDAMGQRENSKFETREQELAALYPKEIIPYVCDERIDLAPNLTFCGELNITPTATNPLEGLENYTYRKSTIVPHPKFAMKPIPTVRGEGVKLMYSTGCVTRRNYIKRKVGFKAEHFHAYGALVVEIDDRGCWYVRQVEHGPDGAAHDMNRRAIKGKVEYQDPKRGGFVENIMWGDIHALKLDEEIAEISFGHDPNSMLEVLRAKSQCVHDLLDFSPRSHHTRRDPHEVYRSHIEGLWELTPELILTANALWNRIARSWCDTFVVNSNHDRHLDRFIKEVDWRFDPINAQMILALNLQTLKAIDLGIKLNLMQVALEYGYNKLEPRPEKSFVKFLSEDESLILLPKIDGGIEAGIHGDRGSNGAKGSLATFAKIDRKTNTADKHSGGIQNHAYQGGVTGKLDMGYNHGLSSWTHSHIVTYTNGTRAIYTLWKGKWRA
jgi:hypothetical protein